MSFNHFPFVIGLLFAGLLSASCERIPEWERQAASAEQISEAHRLLQMKGWLWTCRGNITKYAFGRNETWLGRDIEDFLDYFRVKGLNTIQNVNPKTLLGTALLWDEKGHLVGFLPRLQDIRDIECTNGTKGWFEARPFGFDRSLDLAVLKMELPESAQVKQGNRWTRRIDKVGSGERLSVLSSAYPGQMDRIFVSAQPLAAPLQTGIDDDLILFLPPPPRVSVGGVLVDEKIRVVGYLMKPTRAVWGTALSIEEVEVIVSSILKDGKVRRPYLGFKVSFDADKGFIVQQIDVGSPSHQAGLRVQDVLVEWDGRKLKQLSDWNEMHSTDIGRNVGLTYKRGSKLIQAQLQIVSTE